MAAAPKKAAKGSKKGGDMALGGLTKIQRIEAVQTHVNGKLGYSALKRASEDYSSYMLRRPSTITSLDIALNGGFACGATSVIVGPEGAGKDYLLWLTLAEQQRIYGEDFAACVYFTEFKMDKPFMKDFCGFMIGMTEQEIDEIDESRERVGLDPLTEERRDWYRKEIGRPMIIDGVVAEDGFDAILDYVTTNTCQVVAVNSIGNLQTKAKEDKDTLNDFAQQRNEAMLMSKFMPKLSMLLNRGGPDGERNETAVILINQMRAEDEVKKIPGRPTTAKQKMKPANNAWSLRHLKALEVALYKGPQDYDETTKTILGRRVDWEINKGKLGTHEGLKGNYEFFFDFGVDRHGDLLNMCIQHNVVQLAGSWYSYDDGTYSFRGQGETAARKALFETPELYDILRDKCMASAGVTCRYR
jgi:RecA/RadA recombinase